MAISFVGAGAFGSGTASVSAAAVSGVQAGDLLLLFVESAKQPLASLSGWTQVTNSPVTAGTAAAAGGMALQVFYQIATGADASTTVGDTGDHTTCIKLAYRGVDTTTPFDATPVTGTKTTASTSSSYPGITTVTANAWVVYASALDLDAASTATTSAQANAALTGITERCDQTVTSGAGGGIVITDGVKATAGASGNLTATVTSTQQVYLTLALRPLTAVNGSVTLTGASVTASASGATASGDAADAVAGVGATASAGSTTAKGDAATALTGASVTASAGTVSASGVASVDASVTLTGAASTSGVSTATAKGDAARAITGASGTSGVGVATAKGDAAKTLTGATSTSGVGAATAKGDAANTLTGASATSGVGAATASAQSPVNASVTLTGAASTSGAGTVVASSISAVNASVTLIGATSTAGSASAQGTGGADTAPSGAQRGTSFSAVAASGSAIIVLGGASRRATAAELFYRAHAPAGQGFSARPLKASRPAQGDTSRGSSPNTVRAAHTSTARPTQTNTRR